MASFGGWERGLLRAIGAPPTLGNLKFLAAWQKAEGGTASYNPLNTTQGHPGASNYNSVGVKNYPGAQAGIAATARTLTNGYYRHIVQSLRSGRLTPQQIAGASVPDLKTWGTGASNVVAALGSAVPTQGRIPGPQRPPAARTRVPGAGQPLVGGSGYQGAGLQSLLQTTSNIIGVPNLLAGVNFAAPKQAAMGVRPLAPRAAIAGATNPAVYLGSKGVMNPRQYAGIDQGVDFTGKGAIPALGDAVITRVQASGSGWPGQGAIISYRLTSGPYRGKYVYVAEDLAPRVRVGQRVRRGQVIGIATGSGRAPGIETGWAVASGRTRASARGAPISTPTPEGAAFKRFLGL